MVPQLSGMTPVLGIFFAPATVDGHIIPVVVIHWPHGWSLTPLN